MWISKKKLHAERVAEFQLGLKLGIGIGRNQIRCQLLAAAERKRKNASKSLPATTEASVVAPSSEERPRDER